MGWWRRGPRSRLDEREEMLAHIRFEADRLVREEGLSEVEAGRRARSRFGSAPPIDPNDGGGAGALDLLRGDMRRGLRKLAADPVTTLTILASLVVGIGVNTAIFSIADQALLRPLPVPSPGTLVQLEWDGQWIGEGRGWGSLLPHPLLEAVRDEQRVFSEIAARSPGEATLIAPGGPERAQVALVTGGFFATMGVAPHLGRLIGEDDDRVLDGHPVAVLSHAYWTSRFGADPGVVGRTLTVNGRPLSIIGVATPTFRGTDWSVVPVAWIPMAMNGLIHEWGRLDQPRVRFQHVYARLAPGVGRRQAEASLQPWFAGYLRRDMERDDWPGDLEPGETADYLASRLAVIPGGRGQAARSRELTGPVVTLSAATALLLLLACLNVANLSLARGISRHRETAVRAALGASRGRLLTERLVETAMLAIAGAALGVLAAPVMGRGILTYLAETGDGAMALTASLDGRTLVTATGIALAATLLSGLGPAWFGSAIRPMEVLRSRNHGSGIGFRRLLVVGQVALALVLLTGAGLFGSTLHTLRSRGPGFATDQLVTFSVNPVNDGYAVEAAKPTLEAVQRGVSGMAGVEAVGFAAWPLLTGSGWGNSMLVDGATRFVTDEYLPMNAVTPEFFDLLGVDVVRGRDFDSGDRTSGGDWMWDRVIVSQAFVDHYLEGVEPLGRRIDFGHDPSASPRMEIVGVVDDFAEQRLRDPLPQVYFPMLGQVRRGGTFYLRTRLPLAEVAPEIRARVAEVDPVLTVAELRTVDRQIDRLLVYERMLTSLGAAFASFGTALAMIGIYGVLTVLVQSRRREMGIRIALGASRSSAMAMVVGDAMRLIVLGVAVSLPALYLLRGLVESQLAGVPRLDLWSLGASVVAVLALCLAASAFPARRMARTDPREAFRVE